MANALGPPIKPKNKPKLPRFPPVDITAGAATTEEGEGAGGRGWQGGQAFEEDAEAEINGRIL